MSHVQTAPETNSFADMAVHAVTREASVRLIPKPKDWRGLRGIQSLSKSKSSSTPSIASISRSNEHGLSGTTGGCYLLQVSAPLLSFHSCNFIKIRSIYNNNFQEPLSRGHQATQEGNVRTVVTNYTHRHYI